MITTAKAREKAYDDTISDVKAKLETETRANIWQGKLILSLGRSRGAKRTFRDYPPACRGAQNRSGLTTV
jgi:hypothetical protein